MSALDRVRPTSDELVDLLAVVALATAAVFAFQSSYGGFAFVVVGMIGIALGAGTAYAARRLEWPLIVAVAVVVLTYVVLATPVALHGRAIAGFLPSPEGALAAVRAAVSGWKELVTTRPPVGDTGDLLVLPFLGALVASFASYTLARRVRFPVAALVPTTLLLGVAIAAGTETPVSLAIHGCVYGAVSMAWLASREHRRRPLLEGAHGNRRQLAMGVALLVVASVVGMALAPQLPLASANTRTIWRRSVTPPFDPRQYPSPLAGYRHYVKDVAVKDLVMFTIEGLPADVPVRLATMDAYDGLVWQVSAGDIANPSLDDSGSFQRVGTSIPADTPGGEIATVAVTIGNYSDVWVPNVGEVISLRFTGSAGGRDRDRELADAYRYNSATDTAAVRVRLDAGDRYEMQVRVPAVLERLAGEQIEPAGPRIGAATSVSVVQERLGSAELLAVDDTSERLDRIAATMREGGTYSDGDVDSGHVRARAGHSVNRLEEFVGSYPDLPMIGNAEQYAATYALLFRELNRLPTRVVMGFRPSQPSVDGPVEVTAEQVEAWVEVPVVGKGWVGIFPTPPRDQIALTTSAPQQPEPDYRTQNPPPPPVLDPEFDQPATASGKAKTTKPVEDDEDQEQGAVDAGGGVPRLVVVTAAGIGLPLVVLGLVFATVTALKARRRRHRRRRGPGHVRIANGWREVTDLAVDMGQPLPATVTRREAASFIGPGTTALALEADAAVWAGGEPSDADVEQYWVDMTHTLKRMRSELGIVDRIKTYISVRSLRLGERAHRPRRRGS